MTLNFYHEPRYNDDFSFSRTIHIERGEISLIYFVTFSKFLFLIVYIYIYIYIEREIVDYIIINNNSVCIINH